MNPQHGRSVVGERQGRIDGDIEQFGQRFQSFGAWCCHSSAKNEMGI